MTFVYEYAARRSEVMAERCNPGYKSTKYPAASCKSNFLAILKSQWVNPTGFLVLLSNRG
tara:strand:+ start:8771 stop:8950 length:180 start_codon:yes stop_codon:yes gene_type:complete